MKTAAIVGYGRFGELLATLCTATFKIIIVENNPARAQTAADHGYRVVPIREVATVDFIFLAVPISTLQNTLMALAPLVSAKQVVLDLCSVKVYPTNLMRKYLPDSQLIGTHPMFGPDSAKLGLDGLQVAICPIKVSPETLQQVEAFWRAHGLSVIETTPDDHDKSTVYSQAFTYSLAKLILNMNLSDITFKTRSFNALLEVARCSSNDSEQLFHDMLFYNPYLSDMRARLQFAVTQMNTSLAAIEAEQGKSL